MKSKQQSPLNSILLFSLLFLLLSCKSQRDNKNIDFSIDKVSQFKSEWKDYSNEEMKGIREFVFDEYLKQIEGVNYKSRLSSSPVYSLEASTNTQYYYSQFGSPSTTANPNILRDSTTKSIYFTASEVVDFLRTLETSCPGEVLGLRFYFAKYPLTYSVKELRNQTTIILRGVCGNNDLAHTSTEQGLGLKVARNYGDACPPLCDGPTKICKGGEYKTTGAFDKVCN